MHRLDVRLCLQDANNCRGQGPDQKSKRQELFHQRSQVYGRGRQVLVLLSLANVELKTGAMFDAKGMLRFGNAGSYLVADTIAD